MQSSVQNHRQHFANVPTVNIQRSTFDRSQGVKTTFDAGYLIPLKIEEILPGDTISLKTALFMRMLTPIVPYMDNQNLDLFAFFVPNRLVWDNWEKFMGEQKNPGDSTDYTIPTAFVKADTPNSIANYYGIPFTPSLGGMHVNALPFRGYNLIFNEWFRDQDLQNSLSVPTDNGPDVPPANDYAVRRTAKRHDYFTSARPWPQKGPDVLIPMSADTLRINGNNTPIQVRVGAETVNRSLTAKSVTAAGGNLVSLSGADIGGNPDLRLTPIGDSGLQADIREISGTINQLREAEAIQTLLERDARGGTRYIEMIKSQFGVTNPDFRLQRPELLGSGSIMVTTSPVPQTSATADDSTPQGNLSAYSTFSSTKGLSFTHSFTEHGYMHIFARVRADLNYQQGLHKMWSREKRFDFYVPALAHLGEQAILNQELYWHDGSLDPDYNKKTFGYQERWAEYRYGNNVICGAFRNAYPNNISQWHLAQYFETFQYLNSSFIEENPPTNRVIAVEAFHDTYFGDFWFEMKHTRPMPIYSIPGWSAGRL